MTDLVDYLRDKLDYVTDPVCACPDIDVSTPGDRDATVKGYDRRCPVHGPYGSEPLGYFEQPALISGGIWGPQVAIWPNRWQCRGCGKVGTAAREKLMSDGFDHLNEAHSTPPRKRWWRR